MLEIHDRVNYEEWDNSDFIIPIELRLTKDSFLHEAIQVFYKVGGLDFFNVIEPERYAANWLDFVGELYSNIEDGKYQSGGKYHKNPLSDEDRLLLKEQGVPNIFIDDIVS